MADVIVVNAAFRRADRLGNPQALSYGMSRQMYRSLGGTFTKELVPDPRAASPFASGTGAKPGAMIEVETAHPSAKIWQLGRDWLERKRAEIAAYHGK